MQILKKEFYKKNQNLPTIMIEFIHVQLEVILEILIQLKFMLIIFWGFIKLKIKEKLLIKLRNPYDYLEWNGVIKANVGVKKKQRCRFC